jgi:hypothetical protein
VRAGNTFDFTGIVMYRIEEGKFADIKVAYLEFIHTDLHGVKISLGIPH